MGVYDRQIATARRLIASKGAECTYTQTAVTMETATPWIVEDADPTEYSVRIVFLPVDREGYETLNTLKETDVSGGFSLAYMGAVEFDPKRTDLIERNGDGEKFRVVYVDKIAPNGETILYRMLLAQ